MGRVCAMSTLLALTAASALRAGMGLIVQMPAQMQRSAAGMDIVMVSVVVLSPLLCMV